MKPLLFQQILVGFNNYNVIKFAVQCNKQRAAQAAFLEQTDGSSNCLNKSGTTNAQTCDDQPVERNQTTTSSRVEHTCIQNTKIEQDVLLYTASTHLGATSTTTTSSLGVLTTDLQVPIVTETTVETDLLHALQVITHEGIKLIGDDLGILTILAILLVVQEPLWDVELEW